MEAIPVDMVMSFGTSEALEWIGIRTSRTHRRGDCKRYFLVCQALSSIFEPSARHPRRCGSFAEALPLSSSLHWESVLKKLVVRESLDGPWR